MTKNDIIRVKIESLIHGGDGLARHDGKVIFVANSIAGEELDIRITTSKKDFAQAEIVQIINPSPYRVEAKCTIANHCGGCQWQHLDYEEQLRAKKKIVEESFKRTARLELTINDVIASPQVDHYRCKVQLPVQQDENNNFIIGYYQKKTHQSVNIGSCTVQPDILNDITDFIRTQLDQSGLTAYNRETRKGLIRHIVYRYSQTEKKLLCIFVISAESVPDKLKELAQALKRRFSNITGIFVNFNRDQRTVIFGKETKLLLGKDSISEELDSKKFRVSAMSFFQVNPPSARILFNVVQNIIKNQFDNPRLLDVYAGVGNFSIWNGESASDIVAVEESQDAVKDALYNVKTNGLSRKVQLLNGQADPVLKSLVADNERFDLTILDPPRAGCPKAVLDFVNQLTQKAIIYVSCDPVTLARDSKYLLENGFKIESVQPVDMFSHTYHVESVALFLRQ